MLKAVASVILILAVLWAGTAQVLAQGREWPSEMNLGGFSIRDIRGSTNGDGSGTATGVVRVPGANDPRISLTRSARGDVTGSLNIGFRPFGYDIQGSFTLDGSGMRGRGTIRTPIRPVSDASFTVDPGGQFSGTGRMDLGGTTIQVRFSITPGSLSMTGSAPARAQADTPLATYSFSGELRLDCSAQRPSLTAKGTVQRTGKLSNQVSVTSVSNVEVNPSDGVGKANIDGVTVAFDFLRR